MTRKPISIELLLTWAYRDQMVHVASRQELVALAPSRGPGGYGNGYAIECIDSSPQVSFTASPDAFAVHDAVRSLSTVEAYLPADIVGQVAPGVHASALEQVERSFVVNRAKLVMMHAIDGEPPDWIPNPIIEIEKGPIIYARHRKSGQIKRDGRGLPIASLQVVRFVGDLPWDVARARITYSIWVRALAALRGMLGRVLPKHELTEELPVEEPWAQRPPIDCNGKLDIGSAR